MPEPGGATRCAILVKGYPRLSETFIANELLALQQRGLAFEIVSLRHPTDRKRHAVHGAITAPVRYLPEYLKDEPVRLLRALGRAAVLPGFGRALAAWLRDLWRDPTANRGRRFGQAVVLAAELPDSVTTLYAHFIHTPASVARYAGLMRGLPFAVSAHAKDIWTIPDWEKREKLSAATWTVTCTEANRRHLQSLAPGAEVELLYHGVESARFRPPALRRPRDGSDAADPVRLLVVARAVPKKGLKGLLHALATLPAELHWRMSHVGAGPLAGELRDLAGQLGIAGRIDWRGALAQEELLPLYGAADLFCLPSRIAGDGDRDGMPNVLLEAMSMRLAVVSTPVSAIPELVEDGRTGLLVPPEDEAALAAAILALARDPGRRAAMGEAASAVVAERFSSAAGHERLARRFGLPPLERAA
ncbi:glycosyltransferase family 4 protein [Geminicoccaceae bacterium 1502E]|nr:glycosyltransferase family 4 protein [Geminicoccaceae bacterium 1502E]